MIKTNTHKTRGNDMEKTIRDLEKKMVEWDNTQNEGAKDGYNPYRDQIEEIQNKLFEAKDVTWTKEVTIARRADWKAWVIANAKNGKVDGIAVSKKINEQGWNLDALKSAILTHNL